MGLDVTGRYRYPPPQPSWLALSREVIIDPDLPIIDAHHHLWEEGGTPYLLDELLSDVEDGHNVIATIFVQAHYGYRLTGPAHLAPVGETEKVAAISEVAKTRTSTRIAAGIVAHADLTLGAAVDEVLAAHEEASAGTLRAIRHSVSRDELFPDGIVLRPARAGLLADSDYRAGLSQVAAHGLAYEAMLYHRQIPELTDLATAMPDLPIVLDHIGGVIGVGPYEGQEAETYQHWLADMTELAHCPNISVKIGGFGMIITGARWHERTVPPLSTELAEAWRPYVDACLDLFGTERCMFESNFPVDKAMYPYQTLWNAFKRLTASMSGNERTALFSGTAASVYRLPLDMGQPAGDLVDG